MSKILLLCDTHWGCRTSHSVIEEHIVKFHKHVLEFVKENNITKIFHLGDWFDDRKHINVKTLNICKTEFLDELKKNGIDVVVIPGNHDVFFRNTNEVNSLHTLLDSEEYPNITIIDRPTELEVGSTKFLMVPWMHNKHFNEYMEVIEKSTAHIMCGHLELKGFMMHSGVVSIDGLDTLPFQQFDKVLSGHYHSKSHKENVYYLGTAYDTSWADVFDKKFFHVIDTETKKLTPYEYEDRLFVRFVYADNTSSTESLIKDIKSANLNKKFVKLIVREKTNVLSFETVVEEINRQSPFEFSIVDETIMLNESWKDEDVVSISNTKELLIGSIDNLPDSDSIEKDRLKLVMLDLYQQAIQDQIAE